MHISPFDNGNKAIIDTDHDTVPLTYFNIVKLHEGERSHYRTPGYETCIVPATGGVNVDTDGEVLPTGNRGSDVWDGEPEGVYIPSGAEAVLTCTSETAEVLSPVLGLMKNSNLLLRSDEIDLVQYGSDDTKTHRKIKHILGQKQAEKVARLLVSELFTVGAGGWSGFRRTSMIWKDNPMKAVMMKSITSASSLTMVSACSCWNHQRAESVRRSILSTAQPLPSGKAIILVSSPRDTKCIISPSSAG